MIPLEQHTLVAVRHPVQEEKMQAIAPFVADQPRPPHREDEVRSSGWTNQ